METVKAKIVYGEMLLVLILAFSIPSVSLATEDIWTKKADMPTARMSLGTCVVDGKIYAIGGAPRPHVGLRVVEAYDPQTDTWTGKADIPTARAALGTCAVNGKIYAIGGGGVGVRIGAVEEYDPATDTWERKTDAPTARSWQSPTAGVVDGRIYVIGGDAGPPDADVEEYNPATDTWTTRADMPTPRGTLSTTALNDKIYVIGGTVTLFNDVLSTVEEYFPNPLIVDFNGDGIVDIEDLLRLIESWSLDDPMCDIAPRPSGDGVVDVLDLELLMSFWGQSIDDPLLLSHWTLDEAEGMIAYDSAGVNDAYLVGEPVWQPDAGKVGGALMFDGVDDYAFTPLGLNPADGPFSVFAWIKGGEPGQIVLSQVNGANWLGADPDLGCLMTELIPPAIGRFIPQPLESESVITDGQWHRIGFVWDGANRALYLDDILVAEDSQAELGDSFGGLNIGRGNNPAAGTFWSGLIDDIRIYNRAVSP